MRWASALKLAVGLVGIASQPTAGDSFVVHDAETGFTFTQHDAAYLLGRSISYRVAVPSSVTVKSAFDVVIQVAAPVDVGWVGVAWGGRMTNNPLTVAWQNGNNVVLSSRFAPDHMAMPTTYSLAWYEILKTGTHVNSTHWQYTAKCTGCTSFTGGNGRVTLDSTANNRLAFAFSSSKPNNPATNLSTFSIHDSFSNWLHDFSGAANPSFASLVAKNLGH